MQFYIRNIIECFLSRGLGFFRLVLMVRTSLGPLISIGDLIVLVKRMLLGSLRVTSNNSKCRLHPLRLFGPFYSISILS